MKGQGAYSIAVTWCVRCTSQGRRSSPEGRWERSANEAGGGKHRLPIEGNSEIAEAATKRNILIAELSVIDAALSMHLQPITTSYGVRSVSIVQR